MEISLTRLYMYDYVHRLLLSDDHKICCCEDKDNAPMNRKKVKLHKGVDNSVKFRVFGPDRAPVQLCGFKNIYARLIAHENRTIVKETLCRKGSALGMLFIDYNEGDLTDLPVGMYDLVILGVNDFMPPQGYSETTSTPFYTDFDDNVIMTVHITEQAQRMPKPSFVIPDADWTPVVELSAITGHYLSSLYSSAIPGGKVHNHTNAVHTYSVYADNFTGFLEIFGTLDETPNPSTERGWFRLHPNTGTDKIEFISFTGTEAFSFQANLMWMKFKLTPDPSIQENGTVKKIIVRN